MVEDGDGRDQGERDHWSGPVAKDSNLKTDVVVDTGLRSRKELLVMTRIKVDSYGSLE